MIHKNDVGVRIATMRKNLGYSQSEFSELLNVTPQAVSKWETGLSLPDIDILLNMSWIFKTSIDCILDGGEIIEDAACIERSILRACDFLICPQCKEKLKLNMDDHLFYECNCGQKYSIVDGVIDFGAREIPGEQWSLSYRNYDDYLHEHHWPSNANYARGLNEADLIWEKISQLRPRIILDIACGTGRGIKRFIKKINWPATIIMADLSHRILKWNKVYYSTECKNPFVDIVYLACDASNLPIADDSIDTVLSNFGFESMQDKMMDGFHEAFRVLIQNGFAIYNKSLIEDPKSENSKKWMNLLISALEHDNQFDIKEQMIDRNEWLTTCKNAGFSDNKFTKIYGELPTPETETFPFQNEVLQWMESFVFFSKKP